MNYYILQNKKIILFDEDLEKLQNTLAFMPEFEEAEILETDREIITLDGEFVFADEKQQELAQLKAKELVQKLYDIKAEKAYGGVIINDQLIFETNQISITNTVASLALMSDTGTSAWKFYTINGQPITQQITKLQLLGIAQFGQNMINQAFEVEGNFNQALAIATVEELNNAEWCALFLTEAQEAMDLVNNQMFVSFEPTEEENTTPDEGSETNSGDGVNNSEPTDEENPIAEDVTGGEDVDNSESDGK